MKVALLGSKDFDSLEFHLAETFKLLGHNLFHVDMTDYIPIKYIYSYWASKLIPKYSDFLFDKLADRIIKDKPELVVCTYRFIPVSCIQKLKRQLPNVPVVQVNPDQITTFEKQQIFSSPYDFYFTKDPYIQEFMKNKAGQNAHYLPEAFNPAIHKLPSLGKVRLESEVNIDVLVFGSLYPYRAKMVKKLVDAGINVTLFGDKQHTMPELDKYFVNEWITGERKAELLAGAKIVFNNFHFAEIESVNCKFFEIIGCGGFQICDYKSTIDDYSIVDPKRFTFRNIDEAIELIKYYLDKPELRFKMVDEQRAHFLDYHTYEKRVAEMLKIIFP
jgi:spore maturation protein CgeB